MYYVNMIRTRFLITEDIFHVSFSQELKSVEYIYIYRLIFYKYRVDIKCTWNGLIYNGAQLEGGAMGLVRENLRTSPLITVYILASDEALAPMLTMHPLSGRCQILTASSNASLAGLEKPSPAST